jgi:hypothetical protein
VGTHATPVKRYIDNLTFGFDGNGDACTVQVLEITRISVFSAWNPFQINLITLAYLKVTIRGRGALRNKRLVKRLNAMNDGIP